MEIDVPALRVWNNIAESRFEVQLGDQIGKIDYRREGPVYIMPHTEVPPEFRGQGVANHLVHEALEQVKAEGGSIVPQCPFIKAYIRRHPEYQSLVVDVPNK